jgi:putative RecB family exonuclease
MLMSTLWDYKMDELIKIWDGAWKKTSEEHPEFSNETYSIRTAGRKGAEEEEEWWYSNGLEMLKGWVNFRLNSGWKIWQSENVRGIELEIIIRPNGIETKMVIDRIMETPRGSLAVVDLKTGKYKPSTSLQLGFYKVGAKLAYDIDVNEGYYWMARRGEMSDPIDLSFYTEDKVARLITMFDQARRSGIFIPNLNSCNMCGYTQECEWYPRKESND